MNTPEYLDAVREKLQLPSDYALQKPLGVSKAQVSRYRNNLDSFSDGIAIRVAAVCGLPAEKVLIDMHMERAKTPEVRAAWAGIMEKFSIATEKFSKSFETLLSGAGPIRRKAPAC